MTQALRYFVDLTGIELSDDGRPSWIQAMPLGTYDHPMYGELDFSEEKLHRYATSVRERYRETDLDIDYDHKQFRSDAAGWVKDAKVMGDGLDILVDWTPEARRKIKNKEYRYFSPELMDEWKHPKTGKVYQDVLNGGGLTNRPFLKDIRSVNLSELTEGLGKEGKGRGGRMDPKEIRKRLGLPEDASDADVEAAKKDLKDLLGVGSDSGGGGAPKGGQTDDGGSHVESLLTELLGYFRPKGDDKPDGGKPPFAATDLSEDTLETLKAMAEQNPAMAQMYEIIVEQRKELRATRTELTLSEVNRKLDAATIGKRYALSPVLRAELREVLLGSPAQFTEKLCNVFAKIVNGEGMVELGEAQYSRRTRTGESAQAEFSKLVATKQSADPKLSYAEASINVSRENPGLYDQVLAEMKSGDS